MTIYRVSQRTGVKENHPRDVAEVSVPIQDGNTEYLQWI